MVYSVLIDALLSLYRSGFMITTRLLSSFPWRRRSYSHAQRACCSRCVNLQSPRSQQGHGEWHSLGSLSTKDDEFDLVWAGSFSVGRKTEDENCQDYVPVLAQTTHLLQV